MKKNNPILLDAFDEWLTQASPESIRENCRTEGAVFFEYMARRNVEPGTVRNIIHGNTELEPAVLWRSENLGIVRNALICYYYGQAVIDDHEEESGQLADRKTAINLANRVWSNFNEN
ncbi:MAG: hypothetical protein AAGA46_03165 [Cyanobacteria bacterium P01_F01_bin.13]